METNDDEAEEEELKINSEDDFKEIENEIISNRAAALLASNVSEDGGSCKGRGRENNGSKGEGLEQSSQCKIY